MIQKTNKMKTFLLSLFLCFSCALYSQNNEKYIIDEKFVFHQVDVLETGTDKEIESFPNVRGVIIRTKVNNRDYMLIALPDIITYELNIVNKFEEDFKNNTKIIMYQGGGSVEGLGMYTANIFFMYNLTKNKETPEFVRLEINNSPNIMLYSGIIKLTE